MRNIAVTACVALVLGVCCAVAEDAAKEAASPPVYVSAPIYSVYNWRGEVIDDRPVFQPYVSVTHKGVTFSTWGNFPLTDVNATNRGFSEIDLTLSYALPVAPMEVSVGVINYLPVDVDTFRLHEVFLTAKYPNGIVTPRLEVYRSFSDYVGCYIMAAISRDVEITEQLKVSCEFVTGYGNAAWNTYSFGVDEAGLNDGAVSLTLKYAVSDALVISPSVKYVWLWESKMKAGSLATYNAAYPDPNMFIGGLMVEYSF
ncbi:MAG: hypothetical protein C0404_04960 [Verrucomicrobia bacterium]|nr:hypothetical protein [Verrucomicrobiota bacterium]